MHDRPHLPMSPAEAASLRASSPVDEALLQRIRSALVGKDLAGENADDETGSAEPAAADEAAADEAGTGPE